MSTFILRSLCLIAVASLLCLPTPANAGGDKIFDATRDPAKDLTAAQVQAAAEHKNILLDVGGDWCSWCHLLDRTLHDNAALLSAMDKNYVVLHVNFSRENENEAFLSRFPKAEGFPYLLVLSADGKLLHAQPTDVLETDHNLDGGYNQPAVLKFLTRWVPAQ